MVVEIIVGSITIIITLIGIAAFRGIMSIDAFLGSIFCMSLILLCVNFTKRFPDYERVYINELNNRNPLYAKGYFIKNASENSFFFNIKILLIIQVLVFIDILINISYLVLCTTGIFERNSDIEHGLIIGIGCLIIVKATVTLYFEKLYDWLFMYYQNEKGWQPFNYMFTKFRGGGEGRKIKSPYSKCFQKAMPQINDNLQGRKYKLFIKYIWYNEEYLFYTRETNSIYDIFLLISIEKFEKNSMEKFDKVFSLFWKEYGKGKTMRDKIRLSTLVYAENDFEEKLYKRLRKIDSDSGEYLRINRKLITNGSIRQKKNRYRVFAKVSLNDGKFRMYQYNNEFFRCKEFKEMQKEMIEIINLYGDE